MDRQIRIIFACMLFALAPPAMALELFGVSLETTSRDELREAARNAGLVLIREGGEDNWFDIYDSTSVFPGSVHFYLGFVKQDQSFAFAEYEFRGLKMNSLLRRLSSKYGEPEIEAGRFVSDNRYRWQRDGIKIELTSDWRNYKTRLVYIEPANMAALQAERVLPAVDQGQKLSLY